MSQGGIGKLQLPPGWDVNLSRDYPPQHVFGTHLSSMWKTADISDAISGFPTPRNDIWETSGEIPYWWRVATQIWVVPLTGWTPRHGQTEALPRSG